MKRISHSLAAEHFADFPDAVEVVSQLNLTRLRLGRSLRRMGAGLTALMAMGCLTAAWPSQAARYEFDPRRTEVRFSYKMAFATHRGRFMKVTGSLEYDANAPEKSRVIASVVSRSLSTGDPLVEAELKGAEFFDVGNAPVIVFKSIRVRPHSASLADVVGEVTIRSITKPVVLKVSIKPHDDPRLKFDAGARRFVATTRIKRSAFKMTAYESFVGDDVDLVIDAIVRPVKDRGRSRRKR